MESHYHRALQWAASQGVDVAAPDAARQLAEKLAKTLESRGVAPWTSYGGVDLTPSIEGDFEFARLGFYPIAESDQLVFSLYKKQQAALWAAEEVRFEKDQLEYEKLSPSRQRIYQLVVGFFHAADAVISAQVCAYQREARSVAEEAFLNTQNYIETVHQEAYSLAALIMGDDKARAKVAQDVSSMPCVRAKFNFIRRHLGSDAPLGHRYLAGALAEGVFFASLFAVINRFKFEHVLTEFCTMNDWISRDEFIHRDYNAVMAKRDRTFTEEEAHRMATEAYEIEKAHVEVLMAEPFDTVEGDIACGMTRENLCAYARMLVDQVLGLVGVPFLFGGHKAELPWMSTVPVKVNFYDETVYNYAQLSVSGSASTKAASEAKIDTTSALIARTNPAAVDF